jgi:hypothetical protein
MTGGKFLGGGRHAGFDFGIFREWIALAGHSGTAAFAGIGSVTSSVPRKAWMVLTNPSGVIAIRTTAIDRRDIAHAVLILHAAIVSQGFGLKPDILAVTLELLLHVLKILLQRGADQIHVADDFADFGEAALDGHHIGGKPSNLDRGKHLNRRTAHCVQIRCDDRSWWRGLIHRVGYDLFDFFGHFYKLRDKGKTARNNPGAMRTTFDVIENIANLSFFMQKEHRFGNSNLHESIEVAMKRLETARDSNRVLCPHAAC